MENPVVSELGHFPFGNVAHVGTRSGAALVLGQRFHMGCDCVYTGDAGESGEGINVHGHYVSGGSSSSE